MPRTDLTRDCHSCAALCCVATSFEASEDFAFDKPVGGCRHLTRGSRCAVHRDLVARGLRGCALYDCHGAGQRVTRSFAAASDRPRRDEAFLVLRVIHELLWQLTEAASLCPSHHPELAQQLTAAIAALDAIPCDLDLLELDLRPHTTAARALLRRLGALLRVKHHLVVLD